MDEAHHLGNRATEHLFHATQIADDDVKLVELDQKEVDGIEAALAERSPARLPGVDLAPVRELDPEFDVENFRTIARECFYGVTRARTRQDTSESAPLLNSAMEGEVASAIAADAAAHRHHVMAFLELIETQIAAAWANGGREEIDVEFTISAAEGSIDDRTEQPMSEEAIRRWKERWHFERDPSLDTAEVDRAHWGQWLVAHRGWVVTAMARLDAPPLQAD